MKEGLNKKNIVLGKISNHQWGIVISGGGIAYTIPAHAAKNQPLVLRKWKRNEKK